ncbi:hypothetical protein HYZ06_02570 [Candidatus Daviesbacteria bacterium]|nr:hypothetical protein [Candidatus Daviesbacteria bacterium]
MIQIFIFVVLNEALIEYLCGSVKSLKLYLPLLSLAIAIFLSFTYRVSVFAPFLGYQSGNPFFEFLFTGFIIARLSNYLNDFVQKFLGGK